METFSPLRLTDLGGKPMAEDCSGIAGDNGYPLSRKKQVTANPVDTAKPVKAKTGNLAEQLPEGWELKIKTTSEGPIESWERRTLKTGCLVEL